MPGVCPSRAAANPAVWFSETTRATHITPCLVDAKTAAPQLSKKGGEHSHAHHGTRTSTRPKSLWSSPAHIWWLIRLDAGLGD